jgi:hypothetical protein
MYLFHRNNIFRINEIFRRAGIAGDQDLKTVIESGPDRRIDAHMCVIIPQAISRSMPWSRSKGNNSVPRKLFGKFLVTMASPASGFTESCICAPGVPGRKKVALGLVDSRLTCMTGISLPESVEQLPDIPGSHDRSRQLVTATGEVVVLDVDDQQSGSHTCKKWLLPHKVDYFRVSKVFIRKLPEIEGRENFHFVVDCRWLD